MTLILIFSYLCFFNDVFSRWVHLLCALYTPDVAFVKPEKLQCVTLTELPPYKWGAKVLMLPFTCTLNNITSSVGMQPSLNLRHSKSSGEGQWQDILVGYWHLLYGGECFTGN